MLGNAQQKTASRPGHGSQILVQAFFVGEIPPRLVKTRKVGLPSATGSGDEKQETDRREARERDHEGLSEAVRNCHPRRTILVYGWGEVNSLEKFLPLVMPLEAHSHDNAPPIRRKKPRRLPGTPTPSRFARGTLGPRDVSGAGAVDLFLEGRHVGLIDRRRPTARFRLPLDRLCDPPKNLQPRLDVHLRIGAFL